MTNALQNLPPELQARLAAVMAQQQGQTTEAPQQQVQLQQGGPQIPVQPTQPPTQSQPKQPSLIDILTMLRQEIGALRQEVAAVSQQIAAESQVTEAVGHAVGRMYQMFQPSEQPAAAPTYSQTFQNQQVEEESDY